MMPRIKSAWRVLTRLTAPKIPGALLPSSREPANLFVFLSRYARVAGDRNSVTLSPSRKVKAKSMDPEIEREYLTHCCPRCRCADNVSAWGTYQCGCSGLTFTTQEMDKAVKTQGE
jgi:hypothetical protein